MQSVSAEEDRFAGFESSRDAVSFNIDFDVPGFLTFFDVRNESFLVASRGDPDTAVILSHILKCEPDRDVIIGENFSIAVILMPRKGASDFFNMVWEFDDVLVEPATEIGADEFFDCFQMSPFPREIHDGRKFAAKLGEKESAPVGRTTFEMGDDLFERDPLGFSHDLPEHEVAVVVVELNVFFGDWIHRGMNRTIKNVNFCRM